MVLFFDKLKNQFNIQLLPQSFLSQKKFLKNLALVTWFTFITSLLFAQPAKQQIDFSNFLKKFPTVHLPDTIQYAADEFDYGFYEPERNQDGDSSDNANKIARTSISYQNDVLSKPESQIIDTALVSSFLLADTETVYFYRPEYGPDTTYPVYYAEKRLSTNKNFYCIIYERQYSYGGSPYCQKFLCILTKSGKLIDKLKVASADYSGTGILTEEFRVPWFPDEKSIVGKNLTIYYFKQGIGYIGYVDSDKKDINPDVTYQIDDKGKINKTGRKK